MKVYFLGFILFFCTLEVSAQQSFQRVCDTIPYKLVNEKIIIPITVNDTIVNFILDTGGQTGLMYGSVEKLGAKMFGGGRVVGDYGGNSLSYGEGEMTNVRISENYKLDRLKIMVFPDTPFFKGMGVVGIISGDAFANSVITIDSKLKIIVINYPYRPEKLKLEDGFKMNPGAVKHSILKVKYGGIEREVLFDTGAQGFLNLSNNDYKLFAEGESKTVLNGYGISGVGIGGIGKPMDLNRIIVKNIDFAGKKFTDVETIVGIEGITIFGLDMINYGKVIIDYMRDLFYFLPFDTNVDSVKMEKKWDISVLPSDKGFEVTTIWGDAMSRFKFGDKVVNINGVPLKQVEQSQLVIENMMNNIVDDKAYVIIEDNSKKQHKVDIFRK